MSEQNGVINVDEGFLSRKGHVEDTEERQEAGINLKYFYFVFKIVIIYISVGSENY